MEEQAVLFGLNSLYDPETETTAVSWAYRDHPEVEYFILEYYDEIEKEWKPYDNRMGIIEKENI